jgi:hypothetical protein
MNRICFSLAVAMIALSWGSLASAQTTQPAASAVPAPVTWSGIVEQIAVATEKGDVPLVVASLTRDATVRSFESPEPAAARTLVDAAAEWKLLGSHAYEYPPASLAVDIAGDVKRSDLVPDADKRKIVPLDEAEAARANSTAADWLARTLGAERNHLVGIAVYWDVKANRPAFVLMKGLRGGHDAYAVNLAVYGDPMPRRATAAAR